MTFGMHLTSSSDESGTSRKDGPPSDPEACRGRPPSRFMKGGSGFVNSASCGSCRKACGKIKKYIFKWIFYSQF